MESELKIKEKKNKKGDVLLTFLLLISICICIFAGRNLHHIIMEYKAGTEEYDKIKETVVVEREAGAEVREPIAAVSEKKQWTAPITVNFAKLQEINRDVCGWLYAEAVPDINYPVVQGEDNAYYLHRTYERKDNFAGALFLDCDNNADFSSCNTIVYGHNMKNGSMFGKLKEYREKETYDKGKYLWVLTPEADYKYKIFSAYVTPIKSETYTFIKGPGEAQKRYAENMRKLSEIDTGEYTFGVHDKILTLSTCTGDEATRCVVQAVQLQPE